VDVLFERFEEADIAHVAELATAEAGGPFATRGRLGGRHLERRIVPDGGEARAVSIEANGILGERFGEHRRSVMLFGAGHVGRAVMLAMAPLPFDVRWLAPTPGAFPAHVAGNDDTDARVDPTTAIADAPAKAFVVIVTHSHALDLALLHAALSAKRFAYVGVIGSATKRARFSSRLRQAGQGEDVIASFHCPIGGKGIASRLPAAIAAGLVAQLLQHDVHVDSAELPLNIARQRA
jgi:xanthine dehydrogenase accessory factor